MRLLTYYHRLSMMRWQPQHLSLTSKEVAEKTLEEINTFTASLERKEIIKKSLDNFGTIFVTENMDDG